MRYLIYLICIMNSELVSAYSIKHVLTTTPRKATAKARNVETGLELGPKDAALEVDALPAVVVLPVTELAVLLGMMVLGAVFDGATADADDVKDKEDILDVVEGNERDEDWLAKLQNCWARFSAALSSCGHETVVQLTIS